MQHDIAGDPITGVKWTRRTTEKIADELRALGVDVCANTVARFSPACLRPVKNSAIFCPARVDTIPEVKIPVRSDFGSASSSAEGWRGRLFPIRFRIFMVVSSLCSTSPCAACWISSW